MRYWWLGAAAMVAVPASAAECGALAGLAVPGGSVGSAATVEAGVEPLKLPIAICRVTLTTRPSADSDVRAEVWIPQGPSWNGKFVQVGNGGFAGAIPYGSMMRLMAGGYAVAGTDNGHQAADSRDAGWALGHPEKVVDFGWRGVKATTDAAKAVLAAYGPPPKRSYFVGCSDGGREALMTAQRYPGDFDGIVAGAPAADWTSLMASAGLIGKAMSDPRRVLPSAKLPALQAAALKACGGGKPWIAEPAACRFDPGVLACRGKESDACLTPGQLKTVRLIYGGMRNPATGRALPGLIPGAEEGWAGWVVRGPGDTGDRGFPQSYFTNIVRQDPGFELRRLTTADLQKSEAEVAPLINATAPDLTAFRARGGRLIQYHGWNDPAIAPAHSLAYAAAVKARMGDTADFYRLYMVPGMLHCGGGAAPWRVDWAGLLDAWVEGGVAPGTVTAAGKDGTQALTPQPVAGGTAGSR